MVGHMAQKKWVTVETACSRLKVSKTTLYRRMGKGEIESKKQGRQRMCLVDVPSETQSYADQPVELVEQLHSEIEHLGTEIEHLRTENQYLREELSGTRQRSDAIILQITMQKQQLEERQRGSLWRRIFKKAKSPVTWK